MGAAAAPGSDFKVGYAATAMPVRLAIERHAWRDAADLQALPGSAPHIAAIIFWARAMANARSGRPQAADSDIAQIEACKEQLQAAGNAYWATQVDVLDKEAKAWRLAATGGRGGIGCNCCARRRMKKTRLKNYRLRQDPSFRHASNLENCCCSKISRSKRCENFAPPWCWPPAGAARCSGCAEAAEAHRRRANRGADARRAVGSRAQTPEHRRQSNSVASSSCSR